jgi:manganese oxidase
VGRVVSHGLSTSEETMAHVLNELRRCGTTIAAALALAGSVAFAAPDPPVKTFEFYATDGYHVTADGRTLYIWGYSLEARPGTATLPGPPIEVNEGDLVEIHLTNLGPSRAGVHRFPHTIHLHGLDVDQANDGVPETSPAARVGERVTYRFRATHAGTYWYHCHVETVEHLTMGMYGPLVVHPADGRDRAWTGGPAYDRSFTLVLSEHDPSWSDAIADDRSPDHRRYEPAYFFINGRSFPDTMDHPDTHLVGRLGERILVRLINAGYGWRSMHMHGFHFEVVASDGRPLPAALHKDTLSIAPGERYDLLVTLDQLGSYPFHSHVILDNLNDGVYPGGIHTMVSVVPAGSSVDPRGVHIHGHDPAATEPANAGAQGTGEGSGARRRIGGFPVAPAPAPPVGAEAAEGHHGHDDGHIVEMRRDRFWPEHLVVPVGATVTWLNGDPRTHTLVGRGFGSDDIVRGGQWRHTFEEPGVYTYECVNHRSMAGVIVVR